MANTISVSKAVNAREQLQGAFGAMWKVKATIDDQDAVALNDTATFTFTVPGVAVGDAIIAESLSVDLSDGTDH